jgi:hypothetical protein
VATYSTGISATWGAVTFQEMQSLSWNYGGAGSKGRAVPWSDEVGNLTIQCLSMSGVAVTHVGSTATLTITGGGCNLTVPALYESVSTDAELNGVTKYSISLKVLN